MIAADAHPAILAVLLAVIAAAAGLERLRALRWLPAPAIILICTIALANADILPHRSAAYEQITRVAVPIGVFLLLLRADIRRIFRETGALLALYLIGAAASVGGVLLAWLLLPMDDGARIAAIQIANLVGGTINVVAVAHAVTLDPSRFAAMMAGAAVVMNLYLIVVGAMAAQPALKRWLPEREAGAAQGPGAAGADEAAPTLDFRSLALMIAAAVAVYALSDALARAMGRPELLIVFVSIAALAIANLAAGVIRGLAGDREIGTLLMYLFFASLGAGVDLARFGGEAVHVAVFIALAIAAHMLLLLLAGRLLKASLAEVLVASIAGVSGPTTAAAMAGAFDRRDLITPGVLCGLLGFASATFVGLAVYAVIGP